jgi:PPP family 3-phenylpropionic acid transporter
MYTFLVPLYRHYGYSEVTIGILSMGASLASVLIQPLWGVLCDRTGKVRAVFLGSVLVSIPFACGLWLGERSVVLVGIAVFLHAATFQSMGPVLDSWTMKMVNQGHDVRYSPTRAIGSLAYAAVAVLFGRLLDAAGVTIIPPAFALLAVAVVLMAVVTSGPAREAHHGEKGKPFAAFASLMRTPGFALLLVSLTLLYTGVGAVMVFMPLRMEALGGTNVTLGIAMTLMALCEVPAMLLHRRIVRVVRNEIVLAAAMVFFVVKGVAIALAPSAVLLILAQTFQFSSFGLYLPSVVKHINQMVDAKGLVTALMLFPSVTYGAGMMVGSLAGGLVTAAIGVQAMMLVFSGVALCGCLLFLLTGGMRPRHFSAAGRRST